MDESVVRVLPENLANKIAAGEVVERPASIIKELVENSIDAGARTITIHCVNGGKRSIQIVDDGTGMNRDDSLLAFERHATSKIRKDEDLFRIHTLGFRGEALPSIAAVSKICMSTSTGKPGDGVKMWLDGGVIREVKGTAHPRGTSLHIDQLFFNTPARRKFLKSDQTELGHISNTTIRQALARPDVSFKVVHNQRELLYSPSHTKLLPRIVELFGRDLTDQLLPIQYKKNGMELYGYISKPNYHRSGRESMYFYINNRYVKDRLVSHAILEAYRTLLPKERSPLCFLFLKLSTSLVDVNVHPSKTEVRFANQNEVHQFITESIKAELKPQGMKGEGEMSPSDVQTPTPVASEAREATQPMKFDFFPEDKKLSRELFSPEPGANFVVSPTLEPSERPSLPRGNNGSRVKSQAFSNANPTFLDASAIGYSDFQPMGQIDRSFIVLQGKRGMILVDQHTAHERILYERFLKELEKRSVETQSLLFPVSVEFTKAEVLLLEPRFPELKAMGFELELFGEKTVLVRSVPALLGDKDCKSLLLDLSDKVASFGKGASLEDMAGDMIAVMACHAAVRAGEELKREEIHSLLKELKSTNRPYSCPHGRPIAMFFDISQIKKIFLRSN